MEYKISGLQRAFAGITGSATFPHGAISLWTREFIIKVFHDHPGFSISEDWFFGHSCRRLGGRIKMCSAIFVETETPPALFFSSGGSSRGGFGEMTVFKQRFMRWNFFFVTGLWYNIGYIVGSWKLGWWEIGAKLAVFQEVRISDCDLLSRFELKTDNEYHCRSMKPFFTSLRLSSYLYRSLSTRCFGVSFLQER
jgi:hypothetical protein